MPKQTEETRFLQNYGRTMYERLAREALARQPSIGEDAFLRLISLESMFDPNKTSRKGAIGLAQVKPGTAKEMQRLKYLPEGRYNLRNPYDNLAASVAYLRYLNDRFGTEERALQAYHTGPTKHSKGIMSPEYLRNIKGQILLEERHAPLRR